MELLLFIYLGSGLLMAALALPLIRGRVPPNALYGFRTPRTLRDAAVWYPANAYAGRWLLGVGLTIVAAAIGLYFAPGMRFEIYAWSLLAVTLVGVAASLIQSLRYLRTLS